MGVETKNGYYTASKGMWHTRPNWCNKGFQARVIEITFQKKSKNARVIEIVMEVESER